MKRFFNFGKIRQFADAVDEMRYFDEKHETTNTYLFTGSVKLHGTNAAVVVSKDDYYAQSRTRIITPDSDNYGFATWANQPEVKDFFVAQAASITDNWEDEKRDEVIVFFGEWAGKGVQGHEIAISQVPKFFAPFEVIVVTKEQIKQGLNPEDPNEVVAGTYDIHYFGGDLKSLHNEELRIFPVTGETIVTVNANNLQETSEALEKLTNAADAECPFAKEVFGITGPGEGYVWQCTFRDGEKLRRIRFKTKGEKHRVAKQKVAAPVDHEMLASIDEFLEKYLTPQRLDQGREMLRAQGLKPDYKNMGILLKWINEDIISEAGPEIEMLEEKGIKWRDISKKIPPKVKGWVDCVNSVY